MENDNEDYSHMTVYDIVKMVLEEYTGLAAEQNLHIQMTMMWRMAELVEEGVISLYEGTEIEYDARSDMYKHDLINIGFTIVVRYSNYLTFTGKPASDNKNIGGNETKTNKKNGKNN